MSGLNSAGTQSQSTGYINTYPGDLIPTTLKINDIASGNTVTEAYLDSIVKKDYVLG